MSRISRFVVLLTAVVSLVGVMSSAAGAVTWHNTGSTAFTASMGPETLSATGANYACTGASATGAAAGGSTVSAVYSMTGTITYNGCVLAGTSVLITCGYTLTSVLQPAASTTTGNVDLTCGWTVGGDPGTQLCHVSGSRHFIYANPGHRDATWGVLTLTTTSTMTIGGSSCPVGANDTFHVSEGTFVVSAATGPTTMGPIITRTA